jgi:hypothetical protein
MPLWGMILWEVTSGKMVRQFEGEGHRRAASAAFSPDGKHLLSVDSGGTLYRHEVASGKLIWSVKLSDKRFRSIVYSRDRTVGLAVSGTLGGPEGMALTLWDTALGEKLRELSPGIR